MENLPSLLESIYATWLSLSSTMDTMDVIFAIVYGLGLYLLLLPFIDSHLSLPLPNIKFTRKPQRQMTWQSQYRKKFGTHSRKDPKAWRESLEKLKEKEKDGSFLEEISPRCPLNSLGNMFKSQSTKQDRTILPPFWNLKEKSEQQTAIQKLSYPTILGDDFQKKYNQLFWGLPSLHSESLVATAWIPQASSTLPSPFFLFNVISTAYPVQMQDKMSPAHSCTCPLSYLDLLSPPQFQAPAPNQVHPQSPLPALLPSSLPYTIDYGDYGPSCSQSQSQSQCLPTEIQHTEEHLLTKLESRLPLPLMVQRPQEVYDVLAPNLSQDWAVSILPDNFPISCELREKLEQHIQKWLIQHQWDLPHKIQESLEVMQLQNTVTGPCQTRDKPGPSRSSVSMGDHSKDDYKVRFQEKKSGKNLGPILGKISKDPNRYLEKAPVTIQGANLLEPERNPVKSLKRYSKTDSMKHINKLKSTLKAHVRTKSEQINQGLIPLCVRRSWLAMNDGFSMSDIQMETKNLPSSKTSQKSMSSSQKLAFLDPGTHQALEEHIVRFWVKHRWGLPLKMLRPVNLFKFKKVESLPVALCDLPSSTTSVSGTSSAVEVVRFLGKPCQTCLREVVIEDSSPSLGSLLLVTSPSCKGIKRTLRTFPSGTDHEPSQVLPTKSESKHSETLKHKITDTPSQSGTVLEKERETQVVLLLPRRTSVQNPGAHSHQAKTVSKFPQSVETESASQPQVYTSAVLLPEHPRSILLPADTLASLGLGDIVMVGGDNSLVQQKFSTPKHQVSPKSQIKVLAPTYQGEKTKRPNKGNHEGPKLTRVKEKEDKFIRKHQPLPKPTQVPPESPFQKLVSRFLLWIHPKKAIKGQESPPKKGKPTAATSQSPRNQVKKPRVDNNVAEAQELMTAIGQMLEKKVIQQRKQCAPKLKEHWEMPPPPAPQSSYGRKPASGSEQRRAPSHPSNSSRQRYSTKERHIKDQPSQKNVPFRNEPQTLQNPSLLLCNTTLNLVSSSQNRTIVPTVSSYHICCPRHCAFRRSIYSQLDTRFH
ncbi:spermatogenesis-associated protein 31-like [Arvicola amphibius]|uniref:spermatogenesis-associated protein 31-like n=1 Tax=Arvicola amphibius TaxID=1047088 RepID=UPI0018E3E417|nr:spermatogenesis-associated protein 31-like [Arvicola amphibius]